MNKFFLPLMASAFILATSALAQTPAPATNAPTTAPAAPAAPVETTTTRPHHDHHPELHKAMRKLRGAKEDLDKAAHDYGGHKAKAIAAINEALEELHEALDYDK